MSKKKIKKYRIVKNTNNSVSPPHVSFVIERRVRFFWIVWWTENINIHPNNTSYSKLSDAKTLVDVLNGDKEWINKHIIESHELKALLDEHE